MQLPLAIPLFRSARLIWLLALAHSLALATIWPLQLPPALAVALAVMVAVSAGLSLRHAWNGLPAAIHLGKRGEIEVESVAGERETAVVLPQTMALPGMIVLLLRAGSRRENLVLPIDATGPAAHRQLRLWLRWRSSAGA